MKTRLLLLTVAVLAIAAPALAHVEVSPEEAERDSTVTLTFTVPNEEDNVSTVKVEVFFPEGATFSTVAADDVSGWTAAATKTSVVWSGGTISGDDEVVFPVRLGPLPDRDQMVFKVLQTYDNGEVVRWIDIQTGSDEPEHPAPVVKLTGVTASTSTTASPESDEDDDDSPVLVIVLGALLLAGVGAGIAIAMLRRRST